jgi:hypothetical protein
MKLIDNWKVELHRLWTVRISLFFGVLNGVALGLTAFSDVFNPWFFMALNMLVYGVIALARLLKQADPKQAAPATVPAAPVQP